MPTNQSESIMTPIEIRFIELEETVVANDPEYRRLNSKIISTYGKLHSSIPAGLKHVLCEFEYLTSRKAFIEARIMYENGLNDGTDSPIDERENVNEHSKGVACSLLSLRENEIMNLICEGAKNREIAKKLYISEKTAQNHVSSIFKKLGVFNRAQAKNTFSKNAI